MSISGPSAAPLRLAVSHNQIGQRLGRKGQQTRERILAAMLRLLADQDGPPVTLTSVANEAAVRLSNLYLYFPDIGELLLAALAEVMATAETAYLEHLRERWPDDGLRESCRAFLQAHYAFWERNARILHMRNALADAGDLRVLRYRNAVTVPVIELLGAQMDCHPDMEDASGMRVATVLLACLERVATVVTNPNFSITLADSDSGSRADSIHGLIEAEAEVLFLAIAHRRSLANS